jgi:hypothetical protein
MALQIRRGTELQRQAVTFLDGEPAWVTDAKQLYMGQNSILGGILIGGKTAHILEWQTDVLYTESELVFCDEIENNEIYVCLEEHTSGDFETDLNDNKWEKLIVRSYIESFDSADWIEEGELAYIEVEHGLKTLVYNTSMFEGVEKVLIHKIETVDANNIKIYVTKDDEFTGQILIQK